MHHAATTNFFKTVTTGRHRQPLPTHKNKTDRERTYTILYRIVITHACCICMVASQLTELACSGMRTFELTVHHAALRMCKWVRREDRVQTMAKGEGHGRGMASGAPHSAMHVQCQCPYDCDSKCMALRHPQAAVAVPGGARPGGRQRAATPSRYYLFQAQCIVSASCQCHCH